MLHQIRQQEEAEEMAQALADLEKLLKLRKTKFVGGNQGLQAQCAQAIVSHLKMVLQNGRKWADAAEHSAETLGFTAKWGSHQLRKWSHHWLQV